MMSGNEKKTPVFQKRKKKSFLPMPSVIMLMGVLYNAFLAFLNARGLPINEAAVTLTELLIVLMGATYIVLQNKNLKRPFVHYLFFISISTFSLLVMAYNEFFFIKFIRDMALIVLFAMLGGLCDEKSLIKTFRILTLVVLGGIFLEIRFTRVFIELFAPASYYQDTRGLMNQMGYGLFGGAMASPERFSFGILDVPRLCSVFLEQVSLANFSMILSIFTATFWEKLVKRDRLFFLFTIILIIVGNNTRTGSTFVSLMFFGFWIFPRLPSKMQILMIPAVLIFARVFVFDPDAVPERWGDDLEGRVGLTMWMLSELDVQSFLTGNLDTVFKTPDSGYVYLICASTVFGSIMYWLYTSLIVAGTDTQTKRFAYGASLFIAVNLMIGAAIFTIKVSAPLWFIGGFLYQKVCLLEEQKQNKRFHGLLSRA